MRRFLHLSRSSVVTNVFEGCSRGRGWEGRGEDGGDGPSRPSGRWGGTVASSGTFFHPAEGGARRSAASLSPGSGATIAPSGRCFFPVRWREPAGASLIPQLRLGDVSNSSCKFFPQLVFFQLVFLLDSKLRSVTRVPLLVLSLFVFSSF